MPITHMHAGDGRWVHANHHPLSMQAMGACHLCMQATATCQQFIIHKCVMSRSNLSVHSVLTPTPISHTHHHPPINQLPTPLRRSGRGRRMGRLEPPTNQPTNQPTSPPQPPTDQDAINAWVNSNGSTLGYTQSQPQIGDPGLFGEDLDRDGKPRMEEGGGDEYQPDAGDSYQPATVTLVSTKSGVVWDLDKQVTQGSGLDFRNADKGEGRRCVAGHFLLGWLSVGQTDLRDAWGPGWAACLLG